MLGALCEKAGSLCAGEAIYTFLFRLHDLRPAPGPLSQGTLPKMHARVWGAWVQIPALLSVFGDPYPALVC